jgi:ribosomal protein S18 acetylase RimI-like enzyme
MNACTLRPAVTDDADAIGALHVAAWRETYASLMPAAMLQGLSVESRTALWRRVLADPRSAVVVAEGAGALAGFCSCGPQRSAALAEQGYDGEITAIYVLRRFQERGVGSALMAAAAEALGRRSFKAAALWVLDRNEPARRFYERRGGLLVGTRTESTNGTVLTEVAYGWPDLGPLRGAV